MGKRLSSIFLAVIMTVALMPTAAFAADAAMPFAGGLGVEGDPYLIENEEQLQAMAAKINEDAAYASAQYRLEQNITLVEPWSPIASTFKGMLDGNGKTITGLTIQTTSSNAALFQKVSGVVKDLGLVDAKVAGGNYSAGIAGALDGGVVQQCFVSGSISGGDSVGGIVGALMDGGMLDACYSTASVSGAKTSIGGLVGFIRGGSSITYCYSAGSVLGANKVGGLVGNIDGTSTIVRCATVGSSVSATNSGSSVGRVWGAVNGSGLVAANNYAFEGMGVTSNESAVVDLQKGADKQGGADASKLNLADASWWTSAPGFMAAPLGAWTFATGSLPVLWGETNPTPSHLIDSYTVKFDSNGGNAITSQVVKGGSTVVKPTDPTKAGFTFVGWFRASDGAVQWDFSSDVVEDDMTLYAQWAAVPLYSVRTLTDTTGAITLSGSMTDDAQLSVEVLGSNDSLRAMGFIFDLTKEQIAGAYDVKLSRGAYQGPLNISFVVGKEYNGKQILVMHRKANGDIEKLLSTCTDGTVSVSVEELSPFVLSAAKDTAQAFPGKTLAKTGDTLLLGLVALGGFALLGALLAFGSLRARRRSN
ncbi:MAG: InlB B-repeat-containing protein [Gordonibacter sp.]|nr:InlB B-repeat-containing protein [Gordonibacter sp.]